MLYFQFYQKAAIIGSIDKELITEMFHKVVGDLEEVQADEEYISYREVRRVMFYSLVAQSAMTQAACNGRGLNPPMTKEVCEVSSFKHHTIIPTAMLWPSGP